MFCPPNAHLSFVCGVCLAEKLQVGRKASNILQVPESPVFMHIVPKNVVPYSINCLSM